MINPYFLETLASLTEKLLPLIKEKDVWPQNIQCVQNYPKVSFNDSPFPDIFNSLGQTDVSVLFNKGYNGRKPDIDLDDFSEYRELLNALLAIPEFVIYYSLPDDDTADIIDMKASSFISNIITAYYYRYGANFQKEKLKELYEPFENYTYAADLYFDIAIPILFVTFETDYFEINATTFLRRITEDIHRSKHHIRSYSPPIADALIRSASHELVLQSYSVKKPTNAFVFNLFGDAHVYPHQIIKKFFNALKILTDHTSGYAQLVVHPHNWAKHYNADLTPLTGTSVKNYPSYFDDFFWNNKSYPSVSDEKLFEVSSLYNKILNNSENKLEFALNRFHKSNMREEEEDIILDLIIALEVLLSDNEKGELTHKLALRIATLLANFQPGKPKASEIFGSVKKIYDYRSAIVHGHLKAEKKRVIKLPDHTSVKAVVMAKDYLREILKILIDHPQYLEAKEIDLLMLDRDFDSHSS